MRKKLFKTNLNFLFRMLCVISLLYLGYIFILPKIVETFQVHRHDELERKIKNNYNNLKKLRSKFPEPQRQASSEVDVIKRIKKNKKNKNIIM